MRKLWCRFFGEWRVVYPDGGVSMLMPYKVAGDYRAIFGGVLQPSYELPPCGMRTISIAPYTRDELEAIRSGEPDASIEPRTAASIAEGMSWCRKCGNTWNWKEPFRIPVGPLSCCFPVCADCGPQMSGMELFELVKQLVTEWNRTGGQEGGVSRPANDDREQAEYAAKALSLWDALGTTGEDPDGTWKRLGPGTMTEARWPS